MRGYDARVVERLRPYVTALPKDPTRSDPTKINANTAGGRVLAAYLTGPAEKIGALVAARDKEPLKDAQAFDTLARGLGFTPAADAFDVKSQWFSVLVRVQQDDVLLGAEALVKRADVQAGGATTIAWKRPRY